MTTPHYLIAGLGQSGQSALRYLQSLGVRISVTDSRTPPPISLSLSPEIEAQFGPFNAEFFHSATHIIASPGLDLRHPIFAHSVAQKKPLWSDVELFAQHLVTLGNPPVVAITGSNGKSTVTTLVGEMAKASGIAVAVGGNLGIPALDLIAPEVALYVLELSSFQLETTYSLAPKAAAILNLSADHLDRHETMANYAAIKGRIFTHATTQIFNADDPLTQRHCVAGRETVGFTLATPTANQWGIAIHQGEEWLCRGDDFYLPVNTLAMKGRHNAANALAALALGEAVGLSRHAMIDTLKQFKGLPHRSQLVAVKQGVSWIDDSKGTNVGATLAAIAGCERPVVLIAGGQGKGQDFTPLATVASQLRAAVLIGQDAPAIATVLTPLIPISHAIDLNDAVQQAAQLAHSDDIVLLSPACASLDMFANYQARGRAFAQAVEQLP